MAELQIAYLCCDTIEELMYQQSLYSHVHNDNPQEIIAIKADDLAVLEQSCMQKNTSCTIQQMNIPVQ